MFTGFGSLFILMALVVVVGAFCYGVLRALIHAWLAHRVKLALLEKYEQHPELFNSSDEVMALLAKQQRMMQPAARQDYRLTGIALGLIGLACIVTGRIVGVGVTAVGVYLGGFVCLALAVLITLLGFLLRALDRQPLPDFAQDD